MKGETHHLSSKLSCKFLHLFFVVVVVFDLEEDLTMVKQQ